MGNTSTAGAFVAVKITNDPSVPIVGGSLVNGIVYLDVEIDNVPCDSLNVCLVGHEKSRVLYFETGNGHKRYALSPIISAPSLIHSFIRLFSFTTVQDGKEETKQEKKVENDTHVFLTLDCVLAMFPQGKVAKGRYEFPFVFPLPHGIPGRLYASSLSSENTFSISYHLETRLYRKGVITTDIHHNDDEVRNSQEVMVCDPPRPVIPSPSFVDPVTTAMRFYCCLHTGTMTLLGSLDCASINAGEEAKVTPLLAHQHISPPAIFFHFYPTFVL